jgi:gliding motility-associated-like protein
MLQISTDSLKNFLKLSPKTTIMISSEEKQAVLMKKHKQPFGSYFCQNTVKRTLIKYSFLFAFLLVASICFAQNNSDCDDAVSVCDAQYDEQNSPAGTGQVFEMAPGTCQTGGEFNSAWYVFSPQSDGALSFILEPNGMFDDYDWSLFDITENGCSGINSGASPEISCNSYGENTGVVQGPTGISSDLGGFGNLNGPGNFNGPPFNADLSVTAGSVYALVIMNFSSTLDGYTLDFGDSQSSIFDNDAPVLNDVVVECESSQVDLFFSESIDVSNATNGNFQLQLNGTTTLTPTSFTATSPTWSNHVTLQFGADLAEGNYSAVASGTNPLMDVCGNAWSNTFSFEILPLPEIDITINPACNGENGGATIEITNASATNFTVEFDNALTTETEFTGLDAGTYELIVSNDNGCFIEENVVLNDIVLTANAGEDQVLCDLQTQLTGSSNVGSISWEENPLYVFTNSNAASTSVAASEPGTYSIFCVATLDDCSVTDAVSVTFAYPPETTINTIDATCYSYCDGQVEIINSNDASISATLNAQTLSGNVIKFDQVCSGEFELFLLHSPGCTSQHTVRIEEPAAVKAAFDADKWIVNTSAPSVLLSDLSENADSIFWEVIGYDLLNSSESNWQLQLPAAMGFYTVQLTAFKDSTCVNSVDAQIEVRDEFRFFIPNSFTPNDDDINDVFLPQFTYPPVKYHFLIFNRDGSTVFESTDYTEPWLGEMRNGDYFCPNGTYEWLLKVRGAEIEETTHQGHINLIR